MHAPAPRAPPDLRRTSPHYHLRPGGVLLDSRIVPLLSIGTLAVSAASVQAATDVTVAEVRVEGLERIHESRIKAVIATRPGRLLDPELLADDLKAISRLGPFADVTTSYIVDPSDHSRITVIFTVRELPFIADVSFEGVGLSSSSLRELIHTSKGTYLNEIHLANDARLIREFFYDRGMIRCEVDTDVVIDDDSGLAEVTFLVDQRQKILVGRTIYEGLPEDAHKYFLDKVLVNQPHRPFRVEDADIDRRAVELAIKDLGYLDARVAMNIYFLDLVEPHERRARGGPDYAPDGRKNDRAVITFSVTPGERYRLGSVRFIGNEIASEEELREAFGIADGEIFIGSDIRRAAENARRVVANDGYARARYRDRDGDPRYDGNRIHLTYHLEEGLPYTIRRIDVEGNYNLKDPVIRRALTVYPGDTYDASEVEESERQIRKVNLFPQGPQHVRIVERYDDGQHPGETDLDVIIDPAQSGQFGVEFGYSGAFGFSAKAEYTERNFDLYGLLFGDDFRGANHQLSAHASLSSKNNSVGMKWTNPRVMDGPYSLSIGAGRRESSQRDWDNRTLHASIGIGRLFWRNDLSINASYTYIDRRISDVEVYASDEALNGAGDYHSNQLSLTQTLDRRDNRYFPTEGYQFILEQTLNGGILPGSFDYWLLSGRGSFYQPLSESQLGGVTFARLVGTYNHMEGFEGGDRVPFYDRIYGGGPDPRHRGFDFGDLGPKAVNSNGFLTRQGGTKELLFTAEVSVPLQSTNEGMRGNLFLDYGNVWGEGEAIDLGDMRSAVGVGFDLPTTLPISVDWAFLLDPKDNEDTTQIHISIGGRF